MKENNIMGELCFSVDVKSTDLPFVVYGKKLADFEKANANLQKLVRFIEKKFDSVWYIGTDYIGDEIYERFMFHHGGFMEISLKGEIRVFFKQDKRDDFVYSLEFGLIQLLGKSYASRILKNVKRGQKLISLRDSILNRGAR